jgi:hypothetical protein
MKQLIAATFLLSSVAIYSFQCRDGEFRTGYTSPVVNGFEVCREVTQVCSGGVWSGPDLWISCDNPTEPCGATAHGMTESGYQNSYAPCIQVTRTCLDGRWDLPNIYSSCQ